MGTLLTGQVAVTGTAQQLDSGNSASACTAFAIKAPKTNTGEVFVGTTGVTSSTGYALDPGESFIYERRNDNGYPRYQLQVSDFWAVGTSGDNVTWLASP